MSRVVIGKVVPSTIICLGKRSAPPAGRLVLGALPSQINPGLPQLAFIAHSTSFDVLEDGSLEYHFFLEWEPPEGVSDYSYVVNYLPTGRLGDPPLSSWSGYGPEMVTLSDTSYTLDVNDPFYTDTGDFQVEIGICLIVAGKLGPNSGTLILPQLIG